MAEMQHVTVRLTSVRGKTSAGKADVTHWSAGERRTRSLKLLAMFWGAAIFSVIFPLVHFVLVPGFFIAGPIVAYVLGGRVSAVSGGKATCPECGKDFPIAASRDEWPLKDLCSGCQCEVVIEKIAD